MSASTPDDDIPVLRSFGPYGGLADFSDLDDGVALLWRLPVRYLSDALTPARISPDRLDDEFPSYVTYVRNRAFNAAIRHEAAAVGVGIFAAVPMIAFQACRLFALRMDRCTGLPVVDGQDRLVLYDEVLAFPQEWPCEGNLGLRARQDVDAFEERVDTYNNELATFMFDIAMRYVAMHECMHFALGHARFCQEALGFDVFEDGTPKRAELDPLTSQALEFIADRHAIAGLAHDVELGRLFHEWSSEVPQFVTVDPAVWRRRILFATLALVSRLWKTHGARDLGDVSQPYPHPTSACAGCSQIWPRRRKMSG